MRPCMPSQLLDQELSGCHNIESNHPFHQRDPRGSPQPTPLQPTTCPLLRRPAWTWPSPMHIRGPPVYRWLPSCPMPGDWPVKQSVLSNSLRSKRCGGKKISFLWKESSNKEIITSKICLRNTKWHVEPPYHLDLFTTPGQPAHLTSELGWVSRHTRYHKDQGSVLGCSWKTLHPSNSRNRRQICQKWCIHHDCFIDRWMFILKPHVDME